MFLGLLKKMNLEVVTSYLWLWGGGSGDLFWDGFVARELRVLRYHYTSSNFYLIHNCQYVVIASHSAQEHELFGSIFTRVTIIQFQRNISMLFFYILTLVMCNVCGTVEKYVKKYL
jgi:hypothetical protein